MTLHSRLWAYGPVVLAMFGIAAAVVFDLQLTAERWVGLDLVFRSALGPDGPVSYPVADASPFSIAAPTDRWLHASLRALQLPLWDPTQGGGYSPAVQGNVGVFFPLRWLTALVPVDQAPTALALLCVAAAHLGFFRLGRTLGISPAAAAFAGLAYATSAVFVVQLLFDGAAVMLFLPWLIDADLRLSRSPSAKTFAAAALLFALAFLSGHHMVLFVVFIGVAAAHVLRLPLSRDGLRQSGLLLAASLTGAALAAFSLVPFAIDLSDAWLYKREAAQGASYVVPELAGWWRSVRAAMLDASTEATVGDSPRFYVFLGPVVCGLALVGVVHAARRPGWRFVAAFAIVSLVIALPGPWMAPLADLPPLKWIRNFYAASLLAGAGSLAAGIGLHWLIEHPRLRRFAPAIVAVAVFGGPVVAVARSAPFVAPRPAFELPQSGAHAFLTEHIDDHKVTGSFGQVHLPNTSAWTGIPDVRMILVGFDRRYHRWWELVDPDVMEHSFPTTRVTPVPTSPLLPAFGVAWFLEGKLPHYVYHTAITPGDSFARFAPRPPHPEGQIAWQDDLLRIYRLDDPMPRAFVPTEVVVVPDIDGAAEWIREHPDDIADTTVVESSHTARAAVGSVRIVEAGGNVVELETDLDRGGVIVFNERFDDGWTARVDGQRTEVLPANVIARAVVVPAGQHTVRLRYVPPGMAAGLSISSLTALALLTLVAARRRR